MQSPVHFSRSVDEPDDMLIENRFNLRFVTTEVTERGSVLKSKRQRLYRVIKAHEPDRASKLPRGAKNGDRICSRTQTDIPDHKLANVIFQTLAKTELFDVKSLRFSNGADDWMKCLAMRQRVDAAISTGEPNEFVASGHFNFSGQSNSGSRHFIEIALGDGRADETQKPAKQECWNGSERVVRDFLDSLRPTPKPIDVHQWDDEQPSGRNVCTALVHFQLRAV